MLGEAAYVCESCGEVIAVSVDRSGGAVQDYVEDCPVCCRPNVLHIELDDDGNVRVDARPE